MEQFRSFEKFYGGFSGMKIDKNLFVWFKQDRRKLLRSKEVSLLKCLNGILTVIKFFRAAVQFSCEFELLMATDFKYLFNDQLLSSALFIF